MSSFFNKSIPEVSNIGVFMVLSYGRGAIYTFPAVVLRFLHIMHDIKTDFTNFIYFIIKYLSRRLDKGTASQKYALFHEPFKWIIFENDIF